MKRNFLLFLLGLSGVLIGVINSCKKDRLNNPVAGVATSFTEEFDSVYQLQGKGWVIRDNSPVNNSGPDAPWVQGFNGYDKLGEWMGFTAYSHTNSPDEYCLSHVSLFANHPLSSWLLSPVLSVKNGDKISFYTRGDTAYSHASRLQVLLNKSASKDVGRKAGTVGDFTNLLFDINAAEVIGGYPVAWTKYEYTFSGISGKMDTRIGFRHYVTNANKARSVGIDLFSFQVN